MVLTIVLKLIQKNADTMSVEETTTLKHPWRICPSKITRENRM